jgi:assimilatory nitrate reductase electron transfer subunit
MTPPLTDRATLGRLTRPKVARSLVVVGNGMAGARLAQELRARRDDLPVTVIGAESGGTYNRVLLSHVLAGTARADDIALTSLDWYACHDVTLLAGVRATGIDRDARTVRTDSGLEVPYETLVLATGSTALVPPGLEGATRATPFRTLDDCAAIISRAANATRAVVLGGGLLGLEAARGLAGRGLQVTVLHLAGHLMERQLDVGAGRVLSRTLRDLGVEVVTGARTTEVLDDGVRLDDGRHIAGDLVVLACGVRPDVDLARDAGLTVDRGVVVDDHLRSVSDERIYAIGECAQHHGQVYGLVAPAWEQARVLADVLTGRTAAYGGTRTVTRLKAAGVELAAMGETDGDDAVDIVTFVDIARGIYQKLLLRDERIVGAILLGDTRAAGTVTQLYDRGGVAPRDRAALLLGSGHRGAEVESPARMPDRATVCQCNGVTKGAICTAWQAGARDVAGIAEATRATTGCGTCRDTVGGLLDWLSAADPEPALEAS